MNSATSKSLARGGARELLSALLIMTGRATALVCALVLLKVALDTGPRLVAAAQPLAIAAVLVVAVFARRSLSSAVILGYVVAFVAFAYLRTVADETSIPVSYDYAIFFDRILFLGEVSPIRLQSLLYVPGRLTPFDLIFGLTYVSYFFAPHLAAIVVWRTRPDLFPNVALATVLTFTLGLVIYFLVPTAPPWLAGDAGKIGEVHRVLPELSALLAGGTYDTAAAAVGQNPVAAMPSLHTALTAVVALIAAQYGRWARWAGGLYVFMMGFALVYLGEHYVIDEIAGVALAVGVWRLVMQGRLLQRHTVATEDADEDVSVLARVA